MILLLRLAVHLRRKALCNAKPYVPSHHVLANCNLGFVSRSKCFKKVRVTSQVPKMSQLWKGKNAHVKALGLLGKNNPCGSKA